MSENVNFDAKAILGTINSIQASVKDLLELIKEMTKESKKSFKNIGNSMSNAFKEGIKESEGVLKKIEKSLSNSYSSSSSANSASRYLVNGLKHKTINQKTNIQAKNCNIDFEVRIISIVNHINIPALNNIHTILVNFFILISRIKFINNLFHYYSVNIQKILKYINLEKGEIYAR